MSTIASPRASSSVRSPSSTRTSFDSSRPPQPARRNRAALREFYGLKNAPKDADAKISEESTRTELGPEEDETLTELDAANFNAEAYVDSLLAKEGLKGVLKVEADLISRELYETALRKNWLTMVKRSGTLTATGSPLSTTTTPSFFLRLALSDACVGTWTH
jgi:hypothetical protein